MNNILNHDEHVKPLNYAFEPVQKSTSEGLPFTCRKESLQWQIQTKKCSCHSSWCESCWKRYGKKALANRLQSMDWKHVRHLVLSVDPSLYRDGEEACEDISHRRGIGNLIKNLERTDKIKIVDYAGLVEWYENGFPHWHIFIETEEEGKAGMIGHEKIKRRWPFGIYVNEDYIKSEEHWNNLTGYFNSHGYFEKGKGYQGILPEWAKDSEKLIKRWFGKKGEGKTKKQNSREHLNKTLDLDEGFIIGEKCEECNFKTECKELSNGQGCRETNNKNIDKVISHTIENELRRHRKTYRMKLSACGAKSLITIETIDMNSGELQSCKTDVYNVPYGLLKKLYPWEYVEGVGLTLSLDEKDFRAFVEVIEFLGSGESWVDQSAEKTNEPEIISSER